MYYAQVNEDGICFAVTQTAGIVDSSDMIEIGSYNDSLLGKRRVGESWIDAPVVPSPDPEELPDRIGDLEAVIDTLLGGEAE